MVHCKKRVAIFLSPAEKSLTKLSLAGNNLIIPASPNFGRFSPEGFKKASIIHFLRHCHCKNFTELSTYTSNLLGLAGIKIKLNVSSTKAARYDIYGGRTL